MKTACFPLFVLATATATAQSPTFAAPVRLMAGDKFLGENRLFPSPVYHDLDGDGLFDVVVGDLPGRLTVARRLPGDGPPKFAAETKVLAANGAQVDLKNW
ncbi:MAG TPA: hypothetical protein VFZ65_19120 [Planctomycetota bacterium]|nr:hypothetical protein [Planctomycetota bacterium]